ncbi:MAG: tetratricopeptide repeat protein [Parachlamydiaceae bacterium]
MTFAHPEGETLLRKDHFFVNEQVAQLIQTFQRRFEKVMRAHLFFHLIFLVLGCVEVITFLLFFHFLNEQSFLAFALAFIFLTAFSYFILRLYCQTRKPEQFKDLKTSYVEDVKKILDYQESVPESHLSLADAICRFAQSFDGKEYTLYQFPKWFGNLNSYLEKASARIHWHDVYIIKETVLNAAVEEQIKLIKCDATSLEAHTALANVYILLSSLHMHPQCHMDDEESFALPSKYYSTLLQHKFRIAAERAIEEFKILCDYAPNDPWIHEQLAYSYCELDMPLEAISEYEYILKLNPGDSETLYKLGVLYFQLGRNAMGLQVYEQLKHAHYKKAAMLIDHYGAYTQSAAFPNKRIS